MPRSSRRQILQLVPSRLQVNASVLLVLQPGMCLLVSQLRLRQLRQPLSQNSELLVQLVLLRLAHAGQLLPLPLWTFPLLLLLARAPLMVLLVQPPFQHVPLEGLELRTWSWLLSLLRSPPLWGFLGVNPGKTPPLPSAHLALILLRRLRTLGLISLRQLMVPLAVWLLLRPRLHL
jgi:hypothetical protein